MNDATQSLQLAGKLSHLDWLVLAGYGVMLVASGWWFSRRGARDTEDYFLAGRSMPAWAVAFSLLATAQSAATFVGVPQQSYVGDLRYLSTIIGPVLAAIITITVFLPVYFKRKVHSPYHLLETRFGPGARAATSWTYLLGRVLANGARTYIGALPLSLAVFGNTELPSMMMSIAAIMAIATVYTFFGGVRSVIWTDVLQVCVYLGAAVVALVVLWQRIPLGGAEIVSALRESGKLEAFHVVGAPGADGTPAKFSWSSDMTVLTGITGWMLLNLAVYATDQDLVQRSLTCKNSFQAGKSLLLATAIGVPVVLLFLAIGLLLHVYYQRPDLMGAAAVDVPSKDVFSTFILSEMPAGVRGLMIAGVLAIGPIGINATLNSMASTLVQDTYEKIVRTRDVKRDLWVSRAMVALCAVVLMLGAMGAAWWQARSETALIPFALGIMSLAYTGLLGVFATAILTTRGNTRSAIAALVTGFVVALALQSDVAAWWLGLIGAEGSRWGKVASPWVMVAGFAAAFVVCVAGKPVNGER
jgi:solute:Na+ symporter, SSS family